jgi:excinuclease UvrABC ATPase subunit
MPIDLDGNEISGEQLAKRVTDMGFVRFQIGDTTYSVADPLDISVDEDDTVYVVVDRLIRKIDENFDTRLVDSLRIALEK